MLIGKYKYAVDQKHRAVIPHKFRGDLGTRCVLSIDILCKCLNLYSLNQWAIFSAEIEKLPTIKMRNVRQFIYSNSAEVEIDSQGRIILNQDLCKDVGLLDANEVVIVGLNTHAQIWSVPEREKFDSELNADDSRESIINDLLEIGF